MKNIKQARAIYYSIMKAKRQKAMNQGCVYIDRKHWKLPNGQIIIGVDNAIQQSK